MNREFLIYAAIVLTARFAALTGSSRLGTTWIGISLAQIAALGLFKPTPWLAVAAVALLAGNFLERRRDRQPSAGEGIHLLSVGTQLAILSVCFSPGAAPAFHSWIVSAGQRIAEWSTFGGGLAAVADLPRLQILLGLLIAVGEGDRFVRWVLAKTRALPAGSLGHLDVEEYSRGRVIGMLERTLIYLFTVSAQLGAVGFVLAAKALVHARRTSDRDISYYVLIGTLASASIAVLVGFLVKSAL